jgi:hypothetical protein
MRRSGYMPSTGAFKYLYEFGDPRYRGAAGFVVAITDF